MRWPGRRRPDEPERAEGPAGPEFEGPEYQEPEGTEPSSGLAGPPVADGGEPAGPPAGEWAWPAPAAAAPVHRVRTVDASRWRRMPILAVVAAAVAVAVVVQDRGSDPARAVATETPTPIVAPAGALATAWYCAAGGADQHLVLTNAGTAPARAVVSVMSSSEIAVPATRTVDVPPASTVRMPVTDVVQVNEPGVLVEALAGEVAVSHEVALPPAADGSPGDAAVAPCATEPGASWFFAAGSTERGAVDHVVVFNPFADDAAVDVTIHTPNGPEKPGGVQAVSVPHQSRVTLKIEEVALREPVVGVSVTARRGRVVAEQLQAFDGSQGHVGLAMVPGLARPSQRSVFPDAFWSPGGAESLVLANPAEIGATATISFSVAGGDAPVPVELPVGPGAVATLDLATVVPADVHHGVTVDATGSGALVAALVVNTAPRPAPPPEATTVPATTAPPAAPTTATPTTAAPPAPPAPPAGDTTPTTAAATATTAAAPAETTTPTVAETTAPAPPPPPAPTETTAAAPGDTTATTAAVAETTTTATPTTAAITTTAPPETTTVPPAPTTTTPTLLPPLPAGYEILVPGPAPGRLWLVPGGPPAAGNQELIGIANAGLDPVTVTVNVLDAGGRLVAPGLEDVAVPAGETVVVPFTAASADAGAAALVEADGPVVVARWTVGAGTVTAATAVPYGT